jgi:hypothetical protein
MKNPKAPFIFWLSSLLPLLTSVWFVKPIFNYVEPSMLYILPLFCLATWALMHWMRASALPKNQEAVTHKQETSITITNQTYAAEGMPSMSAYAGDVTYWLSTEPSHAPQTSKETMEQSHSVKPAESKQTPLEQCLFGVLMLANLSTFYFAGLNLHDAVLPFIQDHFSIGPYSPLAIFVFASICLAASTLYTTLDYAQQASGTATISERSRTERATQNNHPDNGQPPTALPAPASAPEAPAWVINDGREMIDTDGDLLPDLTEQTGVPPEDDNNPPWMTVPKDA